MKHNDPSSRSVGSDETPAERIEAELVIERAGSDLVIDADELEADRRDADWQTFLAESRGYRQHLRSQGRLR